MYVCYGGVLGEEGGVVCVCGLAVVRLCECMCGLVGVEGMCVCVCVKEREGERRGGGIQSLCSM